MSHKVLPVLHFILIIIGDLPLASRLIIVSCNCHALLQDTVLLSLVIPFRFVVLYPGCQRLFFPGDKQETGFFLAIKK